jgi:hypothetical protein
MAYFPHAYKKVFVAASVETAALQKSHQLAAGELALLDKTFTSVAAGAAVAGGLYYLAQGSYHTTDKLGPFHGGYQESVKSKGINPKFISKVWTVAAAAPTNAILTVEAEGDCFECGVERYLRLDIKGSPALRFLGRNAYFVADWTNYCCATGQETVDPYTVLSTWAEQISNDPLVSPFVQAVVEMWDAEANEGDGAWVSSAGHTVTTEDHGKFRIKLTGAYVDTKFGDCSFAPNDFYEREPVQLLASEIDETGNACNVACTTITEVQRGEQGNGFGETVLREFILSNRYAQEDFQTDPRMREILNDIALTGVSRTATYKAFNILHSIPRSYNPSGMHNSDQYLLTIYAVDGSAAATAVNAILIDLADAAGLGTPEAY